jgi:radical SAM superfamily enzyme YgiQ (UPF0313 family)
MTLTTCRALLIGPRYVTTNIMMWKKTSEAFGFRYLVPPLGLLTVAALLPRSWDLRLIDHNVEELTVEDFDSVDIVMTGGMLTQQRDTLEIIRLAHARGIPVVVGGPDVTSSPHVYGSADFRVLGEAENIIDEFITAWTSGLPGGVFEGKKFQVDMRRSPVPRYDLVKMRYYAQPAVQYSRGCPFTCEFCDIIELYGRVPRTKSPEQMLVELEAIYRHGVRGPVLFVDDNFIGNKKELRKFLPLLEAWQREHGYPFEFSTQATVNLGDDPELLKLMSDANFSSVFFGIESPDPDTLIATKKKQNAIRDLRRSVANVHAAGIFVSAGIIIGFDGESGPVADGIIEFSRSASIAIVLIGLLLALPNTQLSRRLEREGRLHPNAELAPEGDQSSCGLNFEPRRPRRDVLTDYVAVLETIYAPEAYFSRLREQLLALKQRKIRSRIEFGAQARVAIKVLRALWKITTFDKRVRSEFWRTMLVCGCNNIESIKHVVAYSCVYFDLAPLASTFSDLMKKQIAMIDGAEWQPVPRGVHVNFKFSEATEVLSARTGPPTSERRLSVQ